MTMTETSESVETLFEQDKSKASHYVRCPPDKDSAEAWVFEARVHGLTVEALCGHRWVPESDPIRHPLCQACIDRAQAILNDPTL